MKIYKIKCVDFGWTAKIRSGKNYAIGDLCICRGCICTIIDIEELVEDMVIGG